MQLSGLLNPSQSALLRKPSPRDVLHCNHPLNNLLRQLASWTSFLVLCMQPLASHVGGLGGISAGPCSAGHCNLDRPVQQLHQPLPQLQQQQSTPHDASALQHDQPISERQYASDCKFPCSKNCSLKPKDPCRFGVSIIPDGCGCCDMCARQQGDMCSPRDKCDENKGLYCDMKLDSQQRGICRSRNGRSCNAFGQTYKDGEEFKPNCSQLCTCQDGRYACSSLCPQEFRQPSSAHCRDAQLVAIIGRCCREWVCPHSHSLLGPDDNVQLAPPEHKQCKIDPTQWSSCSKTCGVGVSLRMVGDENCQPVRQQRLCLIRPCPESRIEPESRPNQGNKTECEATWKDPKKRPIVWEKCTSVNEFQLKYCGSCKNRQCCAPSKLRFVQVEFKCQDKVERVKERMALIKSCECHKQHNCPFR